MTIGEIYNFPFLNSYALNQAKKGVLAEYMALFTIAFSLAHIFGHKIGMYNSQKFILFTFELQILEGYYLI